VWGDVEDGATVTGRPTQNHRDEVPLQAYIRRLPKLYARVDALEKETNPVAEAELAVQYQTTLRDAIAIEGSGSTRSPVRVRVFPAAAGRGLWFRLDDAVEFSRPPGVRRRYGARDGAGQRRTPCLHGRAPALRAARRRHRQRAYRGRPGPRSRLPTGSAKVFTDAIDATGITTLPEARLRWLPRETRVFRDGDKLLVVAPAASFRRADDGRLPGADRTQYVEAEVTPETLSARDRPNRTFVFCTRSRRW